MWWAGGGGGAPNGAGAAAAAASASGNTARRCSGLPSGPSRRLRSCAARRSRAAADSEPFAQNLVANFWRRLLGSEPKDSPAQFELLWRRFMTEHNYRVELMLEDLVLTEAFGEP